MRLMICFFSSTGFTSKHNTWEDMNSDFAKRFPEMISAYNAKVEKAGKAGKKSKLDA